MGPVSRSIRGLIVLFAWATTAIATAWWSWSMRGGMAMPGGWTMSMAWMMGAPTFVAMWALMMVPMMLPSLAPVMLAHRRPVRVAIAYFAAWTLVGALLYPIGAVVAALAMRSVSVSKLIPFAIELVLIAAGLVQLTHAKLHQLARCRDRACCAFGRRPSPRQAYRDGLRLASHCIRCCAPPIAALLVLGAMDPAVMLVVAIAITAERLAPRPRAIVRVTGVSLLIAALAL